MAIVTKVTIELDEAGNVGLKTEGGSPLLWVSALEIAKGLVMRQITDPKPRSPLDVLSLPKIDISNGHSG